jgi:origin recognition complex subunit 3
MDRIPFVLLFGIATSVELFHERLSQSANRCLSGAQFDVEQTSSILEDVFLKVVAGSKAPIRLGPVLVSSLMDRQHNHVQSIQAFISTLKVRSLHCIFIDVCLQPQYAYMCHFYANPLSLLGDDQRDSKSLLKLLQPEHLEALRILPSFTKLVETLLEGNEVIHARRLLEDDQVLLSEVEKALDSTSQTITTLLRTMHVLSSATAGPVERIELYIKAFRGTLNDSDTVRAVLDSVKRMTPDALLAFVERIIEAVKYGSPELGLEGWASAEAGTFEKIAHIRTQVTIIAEKSAEIGKPVRSQYAIQSQGLRTTVVAQKVQLSYEKSTLSKLDVQYTNLIDQASKFFGDYFTFEEPHDLFLNEVWLYDSLSPYTDAFTPRPRFAIEQSLSTPYDYLPSCKDTGDALSSANPATAILYQMYLESGSLVNISDIWTAFFSIVGGEDSEGYDERTALMLFYRGLADLRLLGMVKQSKKKVDHLSKSAWKGL